jgi:hypothetical protein
MNNQEICATLADLLVRRESRLASPLFVQLSRVPKQTTDMPGIHVPSFLRQCNDLWALPAEKVVEDIAMPFVSLYMTVCTVSSFGRKASRHRQVRG